MWEKNSEISTLCCGSYVTWKILHETAIPETAEAACTKLKTRILPVQIKFEMYWKY